MMNQQEFNEYIKEHIKDYLPDTYKDAVVNIEHISKNNDIVLDAVVIRQEEVNISPTIYLNELYKDYQDGSREMRDVLHEISEMQQKYDLGQSIDVSMLSDYEVVKDKIVPRLVNAESNKEVLKSRPHTIVADLAVTYYIEMGKSDDGAKMSTVIHNALLKEYGISAEELHETAIKNIGSVMQPNLMSMREMLKDMMPGGMDEDMLPPEDPTGMHILTSQDRNHGASVVLNEKTMDELSEKFGSFFILPSSIHELIILPDDGKATVPELENLVQEVNETQVADQDVLSSHVYRYDKDTKEIYRADKEAEHLKVKEKTQDKAKEKSTEKPSLKGKLNEKVKVVESVKATMEPAQAKAKAAAL